MPTKSIPPKAKQANTLQSTQAENSKLRSTRRASALIAAPSVKRASPPSPPPAAPASKQSQLVALLHSPAGATIPQMTKLTGWQPHTVRGTISGVLRKRLGLTVVCNPDNAGIRVYRIVASGK